MELKENKKYIYTGNNINLINTIEAVALGTDTDRRAIYESSFPKDENGNLVWENPNIKIFTGLFYPFQKGTKFTIMELGSESLKIGIIEHEYNFEPDEMALLITENFNDDVLKNIHEIA